ncbi:MAG: SprT-like domain-containing protein [Lentimicrobium sp.]|nr:SprT-like domain-containing protein [Lentimicrobium sp.]
MRKNRPLREALAEYLPQSSVEPVLSWFGNNRILLMVTKSRRSKFGDFRSRGAQTTPIISVNHDLNPYSFLVTLLHEMAHAEVFFNYKKRLLPHGPEWKCAYRKLALPIISNSGLDSQFTTIFAEHLQNPTASSSASQPLTMVLRSFDKPRDVTLISDIEPNTHFSLPNGLIFRKGEQLRKRFRCECVNNKRIYLFSPLAEIKPISDIEFIS